jgi:hypothetical protein
MVFIGPKNNILFFGTNEANQAKRGMKKEIFLQ